MPKRTKKALPTPKVVNGTQLAAYFDGKRKTFGNVNNPESWEKYHAFLRTSVFPKTTPDSPAGGVNSENGTFNNTRCKPEISEVGKMPAPVPMPMQTAHSNGSSTVGDLAGVFMDYVQKEYSNDQYVHFRESLVWLVAAYEDLPVNDFSPKKLKIVREQMIQSGKLCRNIVNDYKNRIVRMFRWAIEEEILTDANVVLALQQVANLKKGAKGTYDHPKRRAVTDDVVRRTLPGLSPTVAAMVQIQGMTGMRPGELCAMKVGDIDTTPENGLWYYIPDRHKTEEYIGEKSLPLGKPEQDLIAPYLVGKKPDNAVFSPRTAMLEHGERLRAERKSPLTPSQIARGRKVNADVGEFYNKDSYRRAVLHGIAMVNRELPEGEKIPHWTPYLLRHAAATHIEKKNGLDEAQAQLGHTTADMTKRYSHAQLAKREKLAQERVNPFADSEH